MPYKHKIIQGLADLIEAYAGKGNDPMMKAIWWGIKGQVPSILQGLDDNEEAIAEIEAKLREVLGILPEPAPVERAAILADQPEMQEIKEEPVGKTEAPEEKEVKAEGKKKKRKRKATKE